MKQSPLSFFLTTRQEVNVTLDTEKLVAAIVSTLQTKMAQKTSLKMWHHLFLSEPLPIEKAVLLLQAVLDSRREQIASYEWWALLPKKLERYAISLLIYLA